MDQRFASLLDCLPLIVCMHDAKGVPQFVNRACCEFFGVHRDEVLNTDWEQRLHPEDGSAFIDDFLICQAQRRPFHAQVRVRNARQQWRRLEMWANPRFSEQGEFLGMIGTSVDITERIEAEQALRQSEAALRQTAERFRSVLENSLDAAYRRDLTTDTYDYISPVIEQVIGVKLDQLRDMPVSEYLDRIHPEDRPRVAQAIEQGYHERRGRLEYRFRQPDGSYRWLADHFTVQCDEAGRPLWRGGIVRDATAQKQSEAALQKVNETLEQRVAQRTAQLQERTEQLQRLNADLAEAEQRERQRLAQVMHDHLQQTLVGAKMRLGLLRKRHPTTDPADAIEAVDLLLGEAVNLTRSLSAELYPPVLHEHGLVAALRWLAESKANKYHLTIDLNLDPQAEPAPALRTMLFHAARELLFNVQKYAKVKQAHLSLQRPDDQHIVLTVRDQGVGFDPATTSRPRDGGLGLFSIRERIAILGGRLTLESSPGAGTTVTLLVPAPRQTPRAEPSPAAGAQQPPPRRHRGVLRVLLADDHRIVRQGLSLLLGEHDDLHIIGEAGDGLQAIELAQSLQPDVILMDVTMPTLDGIEATRRIKQRHPHIRVIGLSMRDDADTFQAMIHAGADDHLAKDGDEQRLLQAIRANA